MVLQLISTLATVSVPIVVAVVGYRLNQRIKLWEASQWRNQELIKARLQYFGELAPMLNDLMCYCTFIGRWKELSPPEVIALKRDTDRLFLSVAPLFSARAVDAYRDFMGRCFQAYTGWGADARIRGGLVQRRREAWPDEWHDEWADLFAEDDSTELDRDAQEDVRRHYDELLGALVADVELLSARQRYAPRLGE